MEKELNISEELSAISAAVAAIERKNTYSVPEDYFTGFSENVLLLLKDDPQLSFSTSNAYQVPEGFFENFASSVLERIKQEESAEAEIETLSPLLASLRDKETFTVPEGYFNNNRFDAPVESPEAKVFRMEPKKRGWMRYAAAASVAVILGTTAFFTFNKNLQGSAEGVAVTGGSVEQKIDNVSDEELQSYIFQTTDYPLLSAEGEPQVEEALSDIAEQDIKDYLKENSAPDQQPYKGI